MDKDKAWVEIWGDVVEIKSLALSIIVTGVTTMGAFSLAPAGDKTRQLFFGLAGAVLGFIASTVRITPKRIIIIEEAKEKNQP